MGRERSAGKSADFRGTRETWPRQPLCCGGTCLLSRSATSYPGFVRPAEALKLAHADGRADEGVRVEGVVGEGCAADGARCAERSWSKRSAGKRSAR